MKDINSIKQKFADFLKKIRNQIEDRSLEKNLESELKQLKSAVESGKLNDPEEEIVLQAIKRAERLIKEERLQEASEVLEEVEEIE